MGNRQLFPAKSPKELLADFKETGANAPFEEIVRRYAAMVYGVCLRVTGDKHDAEDATQAVFLSLALQAKTSREIKYIGPWLQKVAHRLALDVKKSKTRRKKREEKLADDTRHAGANGNGHSNGNGGHHPAFTGGNGHGVNPADSPGNEELKTIMMEELNQLPPKYRMPLVMHYFGGLSREEMAEQLGCNPSTLGVRVHRGKAMLGTRLAKRGVAISAVALGVLLEHAVRTAAVQPLAAGASAAAGAGAGSAGAMFFAGAGAGAGNGAAASAARVIGLMRVIAKAVAYAKLKSAVAIVLVVVSFAFSTQASVRKFINETLRIPVPSFDVGRWIRPMLQNLLPELRADADDAVRPENSHSIVTSKPLPPRGNPELVPAAAPRVASAPPAPAAAQPPVREVAPRDVDLLKTTPQYSALAQAILDPPTLRHGASAFTLSEVKAPAIGGDDAARKSEDPSKPAEQPLTASAGELYVGAGGGAAGGKPQLYVLPANTTLNSTNVVVGSGDSGHGVFRNLGGNHHIAGTLTIGRDKGSSGRYEQDGGTVTARREVIGDAGEGAYIQKRGVNIVEQSLIVGKNGAGRYIQSGGETVVLNSTPPTLNTSTGTGGGGDAKTPVDTIASADGPNGLRIGENPGSIGQYVLDGGTLNATPQVIGDGGNGTLVQNGGVNSSGAVLIGAGTGGVGNYQLLDGKLVLLPLGEADHTATPGSDAGAGAGGSGAGAGGAPAATGGTIRIGDNGYGTFTFGNSGGTGTVYAVGDANSVVVRGKPTGDGVIVGHGKFHLSGDLVNNSQVIADGFRKDRALDLTSFSKVTSNIENPPFGGAAGWFARRKGKLMLPPIPVPAGTSRHTWGEDANDPLIDLVNSVRLTVHDAAAPGEVSISLLSPLRGDIPALPEEHKFIGLWSIDGADALGGFEAIDVQIRYDDAMAETLGLPEHILKLWEYDAAAAQWTRRDGDPAFARDVFNHVISGRLSGDAKYFAVSAPEPSGAVLMLAATAALLRRRRRNV